ncbi:MAG: hypothetical protein EOO56_17485 [Hymenobacter sp.]|nr:MAG: hypothetical protein EOO56_17485 [Hymenobacter sp.]
MEIVLEVPDKDVARVLELVKGIKRVKIKSPKPAQLAANQELMAGLAEAVRDVKRHLRGELDLPSWDELYAELQAEGTDTTEPTQPIAKPQPTEQRGA